MRQRLPHVLNGPAPPESTVNELLGALSAILSSKEQRGQLTSLDRASSPTLTRLVLSESCYIPFDAHAAAQALWKRGDQECFIHRVHFKKVRISETKNEPSCCLSKWLLLCSSCIRQTRLCSAAIQHDRTLKGWWQRCLATKLLVNVLMEGKWQSPMHVRIRSPI